jgi:MerR family mercuric resistance operon transcriptional regulator
METMTIGQLAAAAGVNVETVRYYQRRRLLAMPPRPDGGIGRYTPSALTRLRFIKRSQSLGFSLDDVQALLSLDDGQSCAAARSIGEHKLTDVRQRIRTLQALESALEDLVSQCAASKRRVSCPLITALVNPSSQASDGAAVPGPSRRRA